MAAVSADGTTVSPMFYKEVLLVQGFKIVDLMNPNKYEFEEASSEDLRTLEIIAQSQLLKPGLPLRKLASFLKSEEKLQAMVKDAQAGIGNEDYVAQLQGQGSKEDDQEEQVFFQELIHAGTNAEVDKVCENLQQALK